LVEEVLKSPEEGFSIEGTEVGMVKIVGRKVLINNDSFL
jgi:hypothetical protein